jgi:hypothetical protein
MACYVYDLVYCKVMVITIYDIYFEDTETQCIMCHKHENNQDYEIS